MDSPSRRRRNGRRSHAGTPRARAREPDAADAARGSRKSTPAWHALSEAEALAHASATREGLTQPEAQRRLTDHGPNVLPSKAPPGWLAIALRQVLMQNVDALNARSEIRSVFAMPLRNNPLLVAGIAAALAIHILAMNLPFLQTVLRLEPVAPAEWILFPLLALTLLAVMELHKRTWSRRTAGTRAPAGV